MDDSRNEDLPPAQADQHWGEAVAPSEQARPGDIVLGSSRRAMAQPLVGADVSTPLDDDEPEGTVPPSPLWAMKDHRHIHWHLLASHERHDRLRESVGAGAETVYVIDDGAGHVMLGRQVGTLAGQCEYCLVGRAPRRCYEDLAAGVLAPSRAFEQASEIVLCGVSRETGVLSSNVFDVARFDAADDVPAEYLPGAPTLELDDELEITAI